jgi:hypothetical protein
MLHDIHTAITQAGVDFQWADYGRYPELLGVGESTVALQQAGGGLLTKIVRAAAKFVRRASRERTEAQ